MSKDSSSRGETHRCHSQSTVFEPLIDNHGRRIRYVRMSVTDRCNLRCQYCMPPQGVKLKRKSDILTWEEMIHLVRIFTRLGMTKLRITGGEPFVRKGLLAFLEQIQAMPNLPNVYITTNGVEIENLIPALKSLNIAGINLSLDAMDGERYFLITRQDKFDEVMRTFQAILDQSLPLKINTVVQKEVNLDQVIPLARLAENYPVTVRFIEEMPFRGIKPVHKEIFKAEEILSLLQSQFTGMEEISDIAASAQSFSVPGFSGRIGIIPGFSRTFCSTCNRIRIKADGGVKTCLYGKASVNLLPLLRAKESDSAIVQVIRASVGRRYRDGFEAESADSSSRSDSMVRIGG